MFILDFNNKFEADSSVFGDNELLTADIQRIAENKSKFSYNKGVSNLATPSQIDLYAGLFSHFTGLTCLLLF